MNRHTVFTDIAGRPTRITEGNPRVTAAAITLATGECEALRQRVPASLPKWKNCTLADATRVVEFVERHCLSVSVASVNRDTNAWRKFLANEAAIHPALATETRGPVGWVKAPVLLTLELLLRASVMANAHAIRIGQGQRIVDDSGLQLIECSVVCDNELSGEETIEIFKSFWEEDKTPNHKLAGMGYKIVHPSVVLATEQDEPLLLLADVVAGIAHSSLLPNPGRIQMPISNSDSVELMKRLTIGGKLVMQNQDFDNSYERIFGSMMQAMQ
jgi:hypothetical protein